MNREEAIEKVREMKLSPGKDAELIIALHTLIPELKESEDEKTKRMLNTITYKMSQHQPDIFTEEENEWFNAYLEKQKDLAAIPDELVKNYKLLCENSRREAAVLINAINGITEQKEQKPLSTEETELNSLAFLSQMGYTCIPPKKEHQNNSDAPKNALGGALNSPLDKDKNLDEIAQDYVDRVKEYNPEPTWDLMQTAVCYGYHYREGEEQKEQKPVMIQWTGKNLKEVIDFTGKSPKFGEWFKSWEDFENYVHSHDDILKLFCEDGSHYEVPVGAWIVKTPDGYNIPSRFRFIQKPAERSEKHIADIFEKVGLAKIAREQGNDELTNALQDAMLELSKVESVEWSEEDEKMLKCCLIAINHYEKTCNIGDHLPTKFNIDGYLVSVDKVKSRLKSLRPQPKQDKGPIAKFVQAVEDVEQHRKGHEEGLRDGMKKHYKPSEVCYGAKGDPDPAGVWKPSGEQMDALLWCAAHLGGADHRVLAELYEHLKKLM